MSALSTTVTLLTTLAASVASVDAMDPSPDDLEFFERRVRPLLEENCLGCHREDAKPARGGLRLTSRAAILAGGDSGPAVRLDDTARSLLLRAVSYEDPERQMPPKRRLPAKDIAVLREWVARGLPDPRKTPSSSRHRQPGNGILAKDHWAFRRPARVSMPPTTDPNSSRGNIDRLLLARRAKQGVVATDEAPRRSWLRRLSLDLTGLPPTRDELNDFTTDEHPDARRKAIDRLLASPRFGERWARHWLDVVRYAETSGHVTDRERPYVWKYRDYVIDAFNTDVPYDRFVREHVAGDLLSTPRPGLRGEANVSAAATGFLWFHEMHFRPISPIGQRHNQIDAQIDVTSKAFLGLTAACARCHDHKFDPIPQHDYYAMAGIFASTVFGHARLSRDPFDTPSSTAHGLPKTVSTARNEITRLILKERRNVIQRQKIKSEMLAPITEDNFSLGARKRLAELRSSLARIDATFAHWAPSASEGECQDGRIHLRGSYKSPGKIVRRGFLSVLSQESPPDFGATSGRLWLADQMASPRNPLTARVIVNRLWQHHFGTGIVRSPNNFGALAETPTHPRLLDYLAIRLVEEGWSLKALHREMLLSRAYGLSNRPDPHSLIGDPENRLVHYMPPRRLEAEAIRDSLLFVSGALDLELGGESIEPYISPNATSNKPGNIPKAGAIDGEGRRSIYLRVRRNFCEPFLAALDFPDPSSSVGARNVSAGPAQALAMLNSPLVLKQSRLWAEALASGQRTSIVAAFEAALGRAPNDGELAACRDILSRSSRRIETWADIAHSLFNSSEFVFRP